MPKMVARQGDLIIHTDGSLGQVSCINATTVLVQGAPIATDGDLCSAHGGAIKSSVSNVFAGPNKKAVAAIGDTVGCQYTGVIILNEGDTRTVFVGG